MDPDVFGSGRDATAVIDGGGKIIAWSEGARRLLGHDSADAVGHDARELLAAELPYAVRSACAARTAWSGTALVRTREGRRIELLVHLRPLTGADDVALWVVAAAAADASGPDTLNRWAIEQLPIAVVVCDDDAKVVRANDAFTELAGATEDRLRGLGIAERISGEILDGAEEIPRLAEQAMRTGDVVRHQAYLRTPGSARERSWSSLLFPLKDPQGRVRGVASAVYDTTEEYWARRRVSVVNAAGLRVGTTLDVTRTAQELAEIGTEGFADFVLVDLLDELFQNGETDPVPGAGPLLFRRCAQASVLRGSPEASIAIGQSHLYVDDSPQAGAVTAGRSSLHRLDSAGLPAWLTADPDRARSIRTHGIHDLLVVPLQARGVTLGLAQFHRHRTAEPFDDEDLLLARELATRAALSIDNARRYTRERATAVTLQRSLLQRGVPEQSAVDVATRYLPAGTRAGVGGDWFDVIPLSGARVALVVGDVVGHGLRASATMAQLRTAVRTLADVDLPPDELLTQLDDVVIRLAREEPDVPGPAPEARQAGELSATCLYAVYDPVSRRCSLASAGHVLPAVVTPDGTADFPDLPVGPPLGLGGLPFEISEFEVPEGSLLALYTDGLIEARDRNIETAVALMGRVLGQPVRSLDKLCDDLLDELLPGRPADDVAILLARTRVLDAARVATWELPNNPQIVAEARKFASAQLAAWGLDEAVFTTELVVSELVTNAIRHGDDPIRLRLIRDAVLICEVADGSNTAPHLRRARVFDEGGRGLLLVAQLTERWGTRHTDAGKIIWAELGVAPEQG
ncbi:SpoIIE family protein phosphatase [Streptomyces sp. HC44]|uniref:SpoIIE family protein phosphatase n=1 Tax=Streptomyces scabichelini TaxID=2711217 RepID=A0A6G4VGJ7_9ACTN|nr:SpoIIE family protein phosphatase [Streptomyces scabichelini]NGO13272.1 SpoIIE family protein phosphatase [Streptomyces scabichelini]